MENVADKRQSFIKLRMVEREKEFTKLQLFKIFVGTWNTNGQSASESLKAWLASDPDPPDLYAVGFQELDLSKEAFLFFDSPKEAEWFSAVSKALHPGARYISVKKIRLVGMMLLVFVKESLSSNISQVQAQSVGTGLMGTMGNKGGVAVSLRFHNTSLCFANAHLAAHTHEYERRNQDFKSINSRLLFVPDPLDPSRSYDIENHDVVFWLGDLNYRLQEGAHDLDGVKRLIKNKDFEPLLSLDQLRLSRVANKAFQGYQEGSVHFPPTYKYDPGTDDWDSSEKARAPAWCDRILWKTRGSKKRRSSRPDLSEDCVKQLAYRSHQSLRVSDHKPVSALFDVKVKVVHPPSQKKVYEDVMKHLDKLENDWLPQVECDALELDFGVVRFMESSTAVLGITNTGQVPVQYSFINRLKPDSRELSKAWLRIRDASDVILPGDKHMVEMEALVDASTAASLTSGDDAIDEILVLHLENGRDIFVTVKGEYRPSCFGCSLSVLCHALQPIGSLSAERIRELEKSSKSRVGEGRDLDNGVDALEDDLRRRAYDIPKELWVIVDHLYRHAVHRRDVFLETHGDAADFLRVRDYLDAYAPEGDALAPDAASGLTVDAVANALTLFLEALPEPVVPFKLHDSALAACRSPAAAADVVERLPPFHRSVFQYLMAFLNELLLRGADNGLDRDLVASLFGNLLVRSPNEESLHVKRQTTNKKMQFLLHFLDY